MANIASYPVLDFSGGIRRDVGQAQMQKNELLDARNVHLNEKGRVISRLGSQQLGQTLTGTIENSFLFVRVAVGSPTVTRLLVNNMATTGVISQLVGIPTTAAVAVGDTTIAVGSTSTFAASGTIEIEGDLIAYTGLSGGTTFTGVTGITSAHASGSAVHQWSTVTQSGTAVNGRNGITYAVLNNICFFGGTAANMKQYDGTNVTDVTGEPSVINLTNYRDRLYGAGDGSNATNGDPRRVSFSNRGDGTTWTTASDFFDVEDRDGQPITAMKVHSDKMGIFKLSKIYTYDEIELKRRIDGIGAFNQKVVQEIDNDIYTFCPEGVFVTNLFSARSIGEPVREFFQYFVPTYDTTTFRVCTNTFSWVSKKSYFLYIGNITTPTTTNSVVLEYNTITKSWTVHNGGYTNFAHVNMFPAARFAGSGATGTGNDTQIIGRPSIIGGDTGGKMWRMEDNRFLNGSSVVVGSDIYIDLRSDTGSPIPVTFETQMYDLTHPELFKKFKRLRVLTESGQWNLEYRVENEQGITPYGTLGSTSVVNKTLPFPSEAQGWSCGFRVSGVNTNGTQTFNGFIFEDTEVLPRP